MQRTQVYLTRDLVERIRKLAGARAEPEAAVIRALLRAGLQREQACAPTTVSDLIGKYRSSKRDTSERVDEILYGKP